MTNDELADELDRRIAQVYVAGTESAAASGLCDFVSNNDDQITDAMRGIPAPVNDELLTVIKDLLASNGSGPKSCGHEYTCRCPFDKALEVIAKYERTV
jgi:hypothetical protein